jgi:hypothetical protein
MASVRNVSSCIMEAKNRYKGLSVEARLSCRWALVSGQCTSYFKLKQDEAAGRCI